MSVVQWFLIGAGAAAYLYAWRYFAGRVAWAEKGSSDTPQTEDIVWGRQSGRRSRCSRR